MIRQLLLTRQNRENIALINGEEKISFDDLLRKALAIRQCLPQEKGKAIPIFLPNDSDFVAALFSVIMFGQTAFPLNVTMTKHELIPLLAQVSSSAVITSKKYAAIVEEIKTSHKHHLQIIYVEELPACEYTPLPEAVHIGADEPMLLLHTSGSTGKNKIVQLSEQNVASAVLGYLDRMDLVKEDGTENRYLLAAPFSSAYGLMILFACLLKAFPVIQLRECFTLDMFYQTAAAHKATHYEGGALVLLLMEQTVGRSIPYDLSRLRHFGFGGSKVSGHTLRSLLRAYPGVAFWQGYGMTEAAPLITKYARYGSEKLESVGMAIKGVEIAIAVDGVITHTPDIKGEIIVKGPNVMLGYAQNEAATNQIIKNGYLYTGDIGYLDEDGYLYICGRKKNVIIVRGLNVHPEEVEACILNSLLVKECLVYGETDEVENEFVCADIVPVNQHVKIEEIKAYCGTHLSAYKQPKKMQMVSAIKKVASGKVERVRRDGQ